MYLRCMFVCSYYKKIYVHSRCLHRFVSKERLAIHSIDCGTMNDCAIILPNDDPMGGDKWLSFRNHERKERAPIVVYADIECILENNENDPATVTSSRRFYQRHRAFSIAYYVCCAYDSDKSMFKSYRGWDCIMWFSMEMYSLAISVQTILDRGVPMQPLTLQEAHSFVNATHCHVCEKPFESDERRVRDHCHLTG